MAKKGKHFRALDEARAAGYEVYVSHLVYPDPPAWYQGKYRALPVRARTYVELYRIAEKGEHPEVYYDRQFVSDGWAWCSAKDNFNRRLGVQIACGRALKQAQGR